MFPYIASDSISAICGISGEASGKSPSRNEAKTIQRDIVMNLSCHFLISK